MRCSIAVVMTLQTVRQNMLAAYEFLDAVVDDGLDLFSEEWLEALLQLNHLVLLGRGYDPRAFGGHITLTRRQFFDNFRQYVKPVRRWYRKHEVENPCKVAAQVYVGVLSQPQLYQEGNHRAGSLIASGILLQSGCRPFVLTRQNALAYFNPRALLNPSEQPQSDGGRSSLQSRQSDQMLGDRAGFGRIPSFPRPRRDAPR